MHVDFDENGDPQHLLMQDQNGLLLTPTARLARAHLQQHARQQVTAGISAWRRPQLLHYAAWLQQLRQQAVVSGCIDQVLIGADQARWLWQQVIDSDVFVGEPKVAQLAERAWQQLHEYRLADPEQWPRLELSEDAHAFRQWAWRFRQRCAALGCIDAVTLDARLPDLIASRRLSLPASIQLLGFELPPTPLQQAIFNAAESAGVKLNQAGLAIAHAPAQALSATLEALQQAAQQLSVQRYADADAELHAAASWARQQLETGKQKSVAIVVPDLSGRIDQVDNLFRQVFDAAAFTLVSDGQPCWHVSLGRSLQQWPLVNDALLLLGLDPARIDQPRIGRVLRSPFVHGWSEEADQRAACSTAMLRTDGYELSGEHWLQQLQTFGNQRLASCVQAWLQQLAQQSAKAQPSVWAGHFQQTLEAFGFARGRKLDSVEFQLLQRWHQLLEAFSSLDVVTQRKVTRAKALALLHECASNSTFRERNPGCPVEILGVAEALGSRFDAIWISTLDADTWPPPARREALLPGPVQAIIPAANSDGCLQLAALQLHGLLRCAEEVRGSLAGNPQAAVQTEPSVLLQGAQVVDVAAQTISRGMKLEWLANDIVAPPLATNDGDSQVRGGTGIIRDQSACAFRAFAVHRLRARELRPPRPGLNAMDRGNLLHQALEQFWRYLPDQAALKALDASALGERIERAASHALHNLLRKQPLLLSTVGQELEQQCLQRALQGWLQHELKRPPFAIVALEQPVLIELAGLRIGGKIDRIDATELGEVLIDYKSGQASKAKWFPEPRIADPQLPLYALAMDPPPQAIAFASLAADKMGFDGLGAIDMGIKDVTGIGAGRSKFQDYTDWSELLQDWEQHLHALSADFLAGKAAVDPRQPEVCKYCHLHALCRIHERTASMEEAEASAS